jgi:hypothetical protein
MNATLDLLGHLELTWKHSTSAFTIVAIECKSFSHIMKMETVDDRKWEVLTPDILKLFSVCH